MPDDTRKNALPMSQNAEPAESGRRRAANDKRKQREGFSPPSDDSIKRSGTAARKLTRAKAELRELTQHLMEIQEQEREWIARELHDDICQRLSLLAILFQEVDCSGCSPQDIERIHQAQKQIEALNTDVRQMSHRMHPAILSDLGLSVALKALVREFGEREKMPATHLNRNLPADWPPEVATAIYRIVQEALRNVAKHAGKTHVKVILSGTPQGLQLKVMDFGIGFDLQTDISTSGLGMISMQERARLVGDTLEVKSALGHGTTITVNVPLDHHHGKTNPPGR